MTSEGNSHVYAASYPYWTARLATGITLAVGDLRCKQEHLARVQLEELMRDFLRSPLPSSELKRALREDLKR